MGLDGTASVCKVTTDKRKDIRERSGTYNCQPAEEQPAHLGVDSAELRWKA